MPFDRTHDATTVATLFIQHMYKVFGSEGI